MIIEKFDIFHDGSGCSIEYHFCREWDNGVGCYGTNPNHGYTLKEAVEIVATWYEEEANRYRDGTHYDLVNFKGEDIE